MLATRTVIVVLFVSLFVPVEPTLGPQTRLANQEKSTRGKTQVRGTPVLWRSPDNIAVRNLYWGSGGQRMQPDLKKVTFLKEEKGGYSTKYRVRDASGRTWVVKIGKEAQSETAAVRLLWAVGYETEIVYLIPRVHISGKGTFTNARFEARPKNTERLDEWKWSQNPFVGTREFQGLKIMMALLNNWDIKDSNNRILQQRGARRTELRYVISDLGATFGQSGKTPILWLITRSRNEPNKYAKAKFVDEVKDSRVRFHYGGKRNSLFADLTVDDARWIGQLLSRLRPQQIRDAFRAANYTTAETETLSREVMERIRGLVDVRATESIGRSR